MLLLHNIDQQCAQEDFLLEFRTGNIFLTGTLDREVSREFSMIISARSGILSNYVMVTVAITGENVTAPKFLQNEYFVRVFSRLVKVFIS